MSVKVFRQLRKSMPGKPKEKLIKVIQVPRLIDRLNGWKFRSYCRRKHVTHKMSTSCPLINVVEHTKVLLLARAHVNTGIFTLADSFVFVLKKLKWSFAARQTPFLVDICTSCLFVVVVTSVLVHSWFSHHCKSIYIRVPRWTKTQQPM